MATQKAAFMETDHPIVRKIWKILEQGIPPEHAVDATKLLPRGMSPKYATKAAELRRLGNTFYTSGNFDEALIYYSKSVATAPADTEELALAYGNRSALFQSRMLYEPCLLDVNRALAGPLRPKTRHRLLRRRRMAWNKLQEQNNVRTGMREGILYVKRVFRQEATLTVNQKRICYISRVGFDDVDLVIDHSQLDDPIWNTKFDGTSLENVSSKIELKYDAQLGPHLVAKEDIDPGSSNTVGFHRGCFTEYGRSPFWNVVPELKAELFDCHKFDTFGLKYLISLQSVGEPLYFDDEVCSLSLFENMKFKYCNYCHFRYEALIPCAHCTVEMYCSSGCREKAYDSYHRVECQILPLWVDVDERIRQDRVIRLRAFLRVTRQGGELDNLMNSSVVCEALAGKLDCGNVQFSRENYPILANVVSRLRYSNDVSDACYRMISRETIAIFAGLRFVRFFRSEGGRAQCSGYSLSEREYFGIMLLVYQLSLRFFSPELVVESHLVNFATEDVQWEYNGRGFSLLQCFTHRACDSNVRTAMNGRHMLAYSVRCIKAGEQIRPADQLASYTMSSREERRSVHAYLGWPECTCKACVEDWPELSELESRMESFRTQDEEMRLRIQTMREQLVSEIWCPDFSQALLEEVIEMSRTIREYVNEPSATVYWCEYYIEKMMSYKGNLFLESK